jgi:Spy/CpxP family protein refolding chaperone
MKSINKRVAIIGLSALLITSAGTALAFGGPKGHHGGCDRGQGGSPMAAISQLDDLTSEQKEQLKEIRSSARDTMRDLRDEMQDNRSDLRDAMQENADLETVRGLALKQGDQVARMIMLRAEIRNKVKEVLTPEQREQLADMRGPGKGFGQRGPGMGF